MRWLIDRDVFERVERLEIPFNRRGIDPFGMNRKDLARFLTILCWFNRNYFKVTVNGVDHVPARGRGMLVGNHSGGVAIDALTVISSLFLHMEPPRLAQGMVEKFLDRIPFASPWSSRTGQVTGLPEHAIRLLEAERLLMVFPEGVHGTAKLYGDRNTLRQFGTGFMRLALQARAPIIPFAFLGGGEAVPTVANLYGPARALGLPYIPITPYLIPFPRPVPLELYFSEPMHFEGTGGEEDAVIFRYVAQVRQRIAELLDQGQKIRRGRDAKVTA